MLHGDMKMKEGGAAAYGQCPVFLVHHRQRPGPVGIQLNLVIPDLEEPGLGVVARGRQDGLSQEESQLLGRAALRGEVCFGDFPGFR